MSSILNIKKPTDAATSIGELYRIHAFSIPQELWLLSRSAGANVEFLPSLLRHLPPLMSRRFLMGFNHQKG